MICKRKYFIIHIKQKWYTVCCDKQVRSQNYAKIFKLLQEEIHIFTCLSLGTLIYKSLSSSSYTFKQNGIPSRRPHQMNAGAIYMPSTRRRQKLTGLSLSSSHHSASGLPPKRPRRNRLLRHSGREKTLYVSRSPFTRNRSAINQKSNWAYSRTLCRMINWRRKTAKRIPDERVYRVETTV